MPATPVCAPKNTEDKSLIRQVTEALHDTAQDYSPSSTAASSHAEEDRPGAVELSGPVGIGKTALVYAAAQVRDLSPAITCSSDIVLYQPF